MNTQEQLLQILDTHFNEEELKNLCFALGVDYDNLGAQGKDKNARELVLLMARKRRLHDLVEKGQAHNATPDWPNLPTLENGPLPFYVPDEIHPYLEVIAKRASRLPLGPLDPTGKDSAHVSLAQVFVNLDAGRDFNISAKTKTETYEDRFHAALAHIYQNRQMILLGDPGSGKSTLLKFIAYCLAHAGLKPDGNWLEKLSWPVERRPWIDDNDPEDEPEEDAEIIQDHWQYPLLVPVIIELRDFARNPFEPDSPVAFWTYFEQWLRREGLEKAIEPFQTLAEQGQLLFLLDGVDEVPLAQRPPVWQAIGSLSDGVYGKNWWVATCRVLSFDVGEAPSVSSQTLKTLNETQINQFIDSWYVALADSGEMLRDDANGLAGSLKVAVQRPRLQALAENPMLLTIMAIVQTYHGQLPDERAKLYQACVETLLLRWQQRKDVDGGSVLEQLDATQETLERLLWEVAWQAHSKAPDREQAADIPEMEVIAIAREHLGDFSKAEKFLEYTEQRAHLLVGRGGKKERVYSFPHRTFQEYLAACYLTPGLRLRKLGPKLAARGDMWREVLNLAAGTLTFNKNNHEMVLLAIEQILPRRTPKPEDEEGWYRVWRAAEMALVVGPKNIEKNEVVDELLPELQEQLAALVTTGRLTPPQRAEAGITLGWLGDPRPDVACAIPEMVAIPAGPFSMGSDKAQDGDAYDDEEPQHEVDLPAYKIGKYPVTVAQYRRFMDDGGYENAELWTEAGWQRRQQEEWTEPRFWQDVKWSAPNLPVVGVSWYEAVAYCHWLKATTGRDFRLPDEAMWEKAARGSDGHIYPWGDEWNPNHLNMSETGIGPTSAVGLFPSGKSSFGILDMCGNVLEWCSDPGVSSTPYPYQPKPYAAEIAGKASSRSLRGGAFGSFQGGFARCVSAPQRSTRQELRCGVPGSRTSLRCWFLSAGFWFLIFSVFLNSGRVRPDRIFLFLNQVSRGRGAQIAWGTLFVPTGMYENVLGGVCTPTCKRLS